MRGSDKAGGDAFGVLRIMTTEMKWDQMIWQFDKGLRGPCRKKPPGVGDWATTVVVH